MGWGSWEEATAARDRFFPSAGSTNQKNNQFCSGMLKENQGHPGEPLSLPTWLLAVFSVDKVQLNLNTLGRREVGSSISDVLQVALKAFFTVCLTV